MRHVGLNEKGAVPIVELILLVAVLSLGGFVAYRYFSLRPAPLTTDATPTPLAPKATAAPSPTVTDKAVYLSIKEWAVKMPVAGKGMTYTLKSNIASLRSTDLDKLSGSCVTNSIHVTRGKANEALPNELGSQTDITFEATYNTTMQAGNLGSNTRSMAAKVGDYYFVAPGYSGASCIQVGPAEPGGKAQGDAENTVMLDIVKAVNQLKAE